MWGNIPTPYGPCSFCYDPYHNVRNCSSLRQISKDIFGPKSTSFSRRGTTTILIPIIQHGANCQMFHGNLAPQFHNHSYSYPYKQYQEEPPFRKRSDLEETMATLEEMSSALEEADAALNRTMSALRSEVEGDRQGFAG